MTMAIAMKLKEFFLALFFMILLLPLAGFLTGIGRMTNEEMNAMEGRNKNEFSLDSGIANFIEDNLGLRKYFIDLYSSIKFDLFHQSTNDDLVIIGKDDWLFLGEAHHDAFQKHSGKTLLAQEEMEEIRASYEAFFKEINSRVIPCLFIIIPDKDSVYNAYYPAWVKRPREVFRPELFSFKNLDVKVVDIRDKYASFIDKYPLYYKTDTHWNKLGAFLGYEATMKAASSILNEVLAEVKLDKIELEIEERSDHDLGKFLKRNLPDTEISISTTPEKNNHFLMTYFKDAPFTSSVTLNDQALNDRTVLIIHDSFYDRMPWPYQLSFKTVINVHHAYRMFEILYNILDSHIEIDLLIVSIVERNVDNIAKVLFSIITEIQKSNI